MKAKKPASRALHATPSVSSRTNKASPAAPDSALATPWLPALRAYGNSALASDRDPTFDATLLISTARRIAQIPADNHALAASLASAGLDASYFAALGQLAESLHAVVAQEPPDRRRVELIPPTQKAVVAEALQHIGTARKMVFEVARATGRLAETRALGRGLKIADSFECARRLVRTFLAGATERAALVADAGVTRARLAQLTQDLARLDAVEEEKAERKQGKGDASAEIAALSLALEAGYGYFRSRAIGAFENDPVGLSAALRYLPRAPERRTPAAAAQSGAPADRRAAEPGSSHAAQRAPAHLEPSRAQAPTPTPSAAEP